MTTAHDDWFLNEQYETRAARRENPATPGRWLGTRTIDVPAGTYRITELRGLFGREDQSINISGLRFKGAGSDLTYVVFDPAVDGPLVFNDYWLNVAFEGFTFRAARPGLDFMHSHTTHAAQRYTFTDVSWSGPWRWGIDLKGDNNNSEFTFYACQTSGMADDGAFLHIGATGTSDQFLNYWFYGFKHWSTGAAMIDAARGGHFHFYGLDASDYGGAPGTNARLFKLRGKTHSGGVQTLTATGVRVEAKTPDAGLIHSEWGDGNVAIQCDWSSQAHWVTYGDIIHIDLDNGAGPIYSFHDSNLAGGVRVRYASANWKQAPIIRFERCNWAQRLTPSEVVSYDRPGTWPIDPAVTFEACRGQASNAYTSAGGTAVWDATVGDGALVQTRQKRQVSIRALGGNIVGATTIMVHLPVGAVVAGLTAVSPGGTVGAWEAWTTERNPRRITTTDADGPFLCSTRDRATITIRATKDDRDPVLLMVEGYW